MSFFRNPEIKKSVFLYGALTVIIGGLGFVLLSEYSFFPLIICIVFDFTAFILTYKRYRKLSGLSGYIDKILHGEEDVVFSDYEEGELSILKNEIEKMTVRLREQSESLKKDKIYLADSMADISHQIRTPLTAINLVVFMLSKPELTKERRLELTRELTKQLERIEWLIEALLKISRLDAGTVTFASGNVSVAEMIRRAEAPIAVAMDLKNQSLTVNMEGNESFNGDLAWSSEAIGNILKNCMEHTHSGDTIEINVTENTIFTELEILDNGPGIFKDDLPHLFERFYKGKNASDHSVGIGLALSRMIITAQNGTVKAENRIGGGAKFTVRFYKGIV